MHTNIKKGTMVANTKTVSSGKKKVLYKLKIEQWWYQHLLMLIPLTKIQWTVIET